MSGRFTGLAPEHPPRPPEIRVLQVPSAAIQYLTALVEACDGIGLVRTLDETRGIIECWIMPDGREDFERLLEGVGREWPIQTMAREFD